MPSVHGNIYKILFAKEKQCDLFDSHVRPISLIRQLASSDWRATVANATKLYDRITSAIVSRKQESQLRRSPFWYRFSLCCTCVSISQKISQQLIPFFRISVWVCSRFLHLSKFILHIVYMYSIVLYFYSIGELLMYIWFENESVYMSDSLSRSFDLNLNLKIFSLLYNISIKSINWKIQTKKISKHNTIPTCKISFSQKAKYQYLKKFQIKKRHYSIFSIVILLFNILW